MSRSYNGPRANVVGTTPTGRQIARSAKSGKEYYLPTAAQKEEQKKEQKNRSSFLRSHASELHAAGYKHVPGYKATDAEKKAASKAYYDKQTPAQRSARAHNSRVVRTNKLIDLNYTTLKGNKIEHRS